VVEEVDLEHGYRGIILEAQRADSHGYWVLEGGNPLGSRSGLDESGVAVVITVGGVCTEVR